MTRAALADVPAELLTTISEIVEPCGLTLDQLHREAESADYGACTFTLNGHEVRFRIAKTTPKKAGQFVTLWTRIPSGPIRPFDLSDPVAFFIVSVASGGRSGQFVFPKAALRQHGVVSRDGVGGKRAMRVYAPWDEAPNRQAVATKRWQGAFFLDRNENEGVDLQTAQTLHHSISDNIP